MGVANARVAYLLPPSVLGQPTGNWKQTWTRIWEIDSEKALNTGYIYSCVTSNSVLEIRQMQSYSSQRNTTIADFQQIQVSTTLSKSSKWKVIEKAFPAPQLWTSTPKNHPTRYCIYTGGLIHQETPDTSSFQWAEAPQRFCTPSQRGCRSRLTICQLNQFITNSEAAMLSKVVQYTFCYWKYTS